MSQIARNLTDSVDSLFTGKRYVVHDRDPLFTHEFLSTLKDAGVESVKLPPRRPNLNAHAEKFVRSIKEHCLERLILFGESSLRAAVQSFVTHYHSERNSQGLCNQLIPTAEGPLGNTGPIHRRERLAGLLNYYYRTGGLNTAQLGICASAHPPTSNSASKSAYPSTNPQVRLRSDSVLRWYRCGCVAPPTHDRVFGPNAHGGITCQFAISKFNAASLLELLSQDDEFRLLLAQKGRSGSEIGPHAVWQ